MTTFGRGEDTSDPKTSDWCRVRGGVFGDLRAEALADHDHRPVIPFRDIAGQEGVGELPGDVGAGAPGIDFGSLRAADGNIHLWAALRESPNGNQPS